MENALAFSTQQMPKKVPLTAFNLQHCCGYYSRYEIKWVQSSINSDVLQRRNWYFDVCKMKYLEVADRLAIAIALENYFFVSAQQELTNSFAVRIGCKHFRHHDLFNDWTNCEKRNTALIGRCYGSWRLVFALDIVNMWSVKRNKNKSNKMVRHGKKHKASATGIRMCSLCVLLHLIRWIFPGIITFESKHCDWHRCQNYQTM